jgi:hypothetical protein
MPAMTLSTLALKRPQPKRYSTHLLARLWQRCTRRNLPDAAPLGELGSHLLRDIQAPGRVHGQAQEHSELARYDRQQARRTSDWNV